MPFPRKCYAEGQAPPEPPAPPTPSYTSQCPEEQQVPEDTTPPLPFECVFPEPPKFSWCKKLEELKFRFAELPVMEVFDLSCLQNTATCTENKFIYRGKEFTFVNAFCNNDIDWTPAQQTINFISIIMLIGFFIRSFQKS